MHSLKSLPIAFLETAYCDNYSGAVNVALPSELESVLESESKHPWVDVHVYVHVEVFGVAKSESEHLWADVHVRVEVDGDAKSESERPWVCMTVDV